MARCQKSSFVPNYLPLYLNLAKDFSPSIPAASILCFGDHPLQGPRASRTIMRPLQAPGILFAGLIATPLLGPFVNARTITSRWQEGWVRGKRLDGHRPLALHVALATPEAAIVAAADTLQRLSDPNSNHYGNHWSGERVESHFAPPSSTVHDVLSWLNTSGIPLQRVEVSRERGHILIATCVEDAERLLNARYYEFHDISHPDDRPQIAVESYHLPNLLDDSIYFIEPTLPSISRQPKRAAKDLEPASALAPRSGTNTTTKVDCFRYMTPECLRLLYNIPSDEIAPHPNNTLGIFQLSWMTWLPDDLDLFFSRFDPRVTGKRPVMLPVNGGYQQSNYTGFVYNAEPGLDFEYAMALTHPLPVTNIQVGDQFTSGTLGNMLAAFDAFFCPHLDPAHDHFYPDPSRPPTGSGYNRSTDCGTVAPPSVLSISYVWPEASFPPGYLTHQCLEFLKLSLQGTTIVAATGDWGVASQSSDCVDPSTGLAGDSVGDFSPNFPASCPYVTAVGGTSLAPPPAPWNPASPSFPPQQAYRAGSPDGERGESTSGGGFSRVFAMPEYQRSVAERYLADEANHTAPFRSKFNPQGRGYPDLSLLAHNYLVVYAGQLYAIDGTSASTPVFTAMVARINNERLMQGKGTLGFLNPVLYARKEEIFEDVRQGSNRGCGVEEAFRATEGWDAVTGLGTVGDFETLKAVLEGLP